MEVTFTFNHLLLNLINEAQSELARLETQKVLLNSAQQQLIQQLKPLLPPPVETQALVGTQDVLGKASDKIPTTSVIEPEQKPSPLPDIIS